MSLHEGFISRLFAARDEDVGIHAFLFFTGEFESNTL